VAFNLIDGAGNEQGPSGWVVAALEGLVRDHPPVLVHCHAGRSRSVVAVAAFLARTLHLRPADAVARVAARRVVCITPEFEDLLYERDWYD
jgi:protein-tyrosine phosphatase